MDDFEGDYIDLVNSFKKENRNTRIILLLPVPAFTTDTTRIWNEVIKNKIIPITRTVAYKTNSEVLDLYQLFIDQPGLLPDMIHPSSLGATVIAKRLFEAVIQNEIEKIDILKSEEVKVLKTSNFYGYDLTDFEYTGIPCKVVKPKKVVPEGTLLGS